MIITFEPHYMAPLSLVKGHIVFNRSEDTWLKNKSRLSDSVKGHRSAYVYIIYICIYMYILYICIYLNLEILQIFLFKYHSICSIYLSILDLPVRCSGR